MRKRHKRDTFRQKPSLRRSGRRGVTFARRHFPCPCGTHKWQSFPWNTPGIDLKCQGCGLYYEVRYIRCKSAVAVVPSKVPGGAYREYDHHKIRNREIDFLFVLETDEEVTIIHVPFRNQMEGFVTARIINSGFREGYEISDVHPARGTPGWVGVFPLRTGRPRPRVASPATPVAVG